MFLSNLIKKNREYRNGKYNKINQCRLCIDKTPSIVANNCIGGVIYHNLGMQFLSPTINLYIKNEDFLLFLSHLKEFVNSELMEKEDSGKEFPVGQIVSKYGTISIYFSHYQNFQEAKKKWDERKQRIEWDNIVVIMEEGIETSDDIVRRFHELEYEKKVLIMNGNVGHCDLKDGFPLYIYDEKYHPGKILDFGKYKVASKRYLDEFDYVEFLNTGKIKRSRG